MSTATLTREQPTIVNAVTYRLAKEQVYVPATHPVTTTAVREAERALACGQPVKIAVAFGVAKALSR